MIIDTPKLLPIGLSPIKHLEPVLLMVISQYGELLWHTDSIEKLLGLPPTSLEQRSIRDFTEPDDYEHLLNVVLPEVQRYKKISHICSIKNQNQETFRSLWYLSLHDELIYVALDLLEASGKAMQIVKFDPDLELGKLTRKEIELFRLFRQHLGKGVEKSFLQESLYGDTAIHFKTINTHIHNLRRKLTNSPFSIETMGKGTWIMQKKTRKTSCCQSNC
ncbi:MAG: helix-turn-helix domain-containing protein [Oligoflexus sp.]